MANKSLSERLDALLEKHAPKSVEYLRKHNTWPGDDVTVDPEAAIEARAYKLVKNDGLSGNQAYKIARDAEAAKHGAPYTILTRPNGIRLQITTDDGNTVTGNGETLEAAVAALEAR